MSETISKSVFSDEFQKQELFENILKIANKSPYLVQMLNHFEKSGGKVQLGAAYSGTFYDDKNITVQINAIPTVLRDTSMGIFVTGLAHEVGHATRLGGNPSYEGVRNPWEAGERGLSGEGVAITSEYVVARQIGARIMHSDDGNFTLKTKIAELEKANHLDLSTRRFNDQSPDLAAFDKAAQKIAAEYYASYRPSTAKNIRYDEYYQESWAAGVVIGEKARDINWQTINSPDIQLNLHADKTYTVTGNQVPLRDGEKLNFSATLSADGKHYVGERTIATHPNSSIPNAPASTASELALSPAVQARLDSARARVHELYEQRGFDYEKQGGEQYTFAVAKLAADKGFERVDLLAVKDGILHVAQKDAIALYSAQMPTSEVAKVTEQAAVQSMTNFIEQQQKPDGPSQDQSRGGPRM